MCSSCVFSRGVSRFSRVAEQLHAGMSTVNDLQEISTCRRACPSVTPIRVLRPTCSAGGLRGLYHVRSVCEYPDVISPPMSTRSMCPARGSRSAPSRGSTTSSTRGHRGAQRRPVGDVGHLFAAGLVHIFYTSPDVARGVASKYCCSTGLLG